MTSTQTDRLIWVDIETSGLDPVNDIVLEVGFRITNLDLETIDDLTLTVWDTPFYDNWLNKVSPADWAFQQHKKSGLIKQAQAEGVDSNTLQAGVTNWLKGHGVTGDTREPLCGSSVQFDRSFFIEQYPEIVTHFSYRNIDVSTIKELCQRYNPALYAKLDVITNPLKLHRVESDLTDTINEFGFYRDSFLFLED